MAEFLVTPCGLFCFAEVVGRGMSCLHASTHLCSYVGWQQCLCGVGLPGGHLEMVLSMHRQQSQDGMQGKRGSKENERKRPIRQSRFLPV